MVSTELITPPRREPIRVYGGMHPLSNEHRQVEVPGGATIAEALEMSLASTGLDWPRDQFVATVNDVRVPREHWHRVRPKPGTTVIFRPVASGDQNLRTLLFLGIAIAAMFIAPFVAGTVLGLTGAALSAGTALIGGAITIGGALLLNALMPIRPPQQDSAQPKTLPMISGAQNEARPWGVVPVVLGRHRISPMFAAMPYSQFIGQNQYMHLLFCCGYGPLKISNMRIGDTSVGTLNSSGVLVGGAFQDILIDVNEGRPGENPVQYFPSIVNEQPLGILLKSGDGWVTRTTDPNCSTLSVDLLAVNGIWIYNSKTGSYDDRPVTVGIQYALHGTGGWIARPNLVFTRNRDTVRMGDQWDVLPGTYDVRVQKVTADYPTTGTAQVADAIQWTTLRGVETGVPVKFPQPLSIISMRARGTDQFNGVIDTFNVIAESYVTHWNGSAWVPNQLSSNPADLFHWVLTGPANARPRKPGPAGVGDNSGQIDYTSIQGWGDDCRTRGYTYNAVISDQRTVREVLADIAAAGRATIALRNGKWGVSYPRDSDSVSWHFTPRNSSGLKSSRAYREMPHALRVRWISAVGTGTVPSEYQQTEGIVYNDTPDGSGTNGMYTAATATLFESVEFPGITDWPNVHKAARFQLAQALLRPETHVLNADIESLRLERGDKVILSTDTLLIGTGYGRVTQTDAVNETCHVDSRVIMETGKSYQITFTLTNGSMLTRTVLNTSNETDWIKFDTNDVSNAVPAVGNLFSFGESTKVTNTYRVLDIRPAVDFGAQVTLVDDADFHDQYDQEPVPAYDPGITTPPDPYDLPPENLTFVERFSGSGITAKSTVQLTVTIPRVGLVRSFEFQYQDVGTFGVWTPFAVISAPYLTATKDNLEAGLYNFRVRSLFREGFQTTNNDSSAWVYSGNVNVLSTLSPPPDLTGSLRVTIQGDIMFLEWDAVSAINVSYYRVKYNPTTDGSATWGSSTELLTTTTNRVATATLSGTFMVKAVTYSDVESNNPLEEIVVTSVHAPINIVQDFSEDPAFAGIHTFTQKQGLLLTLAFQSGGGPSYTMNQGFYQFYNWLDLGAVYVSQITAKVTASGIKSGDTMDHWVSLANVVALDTTDPSLWSVEMVYAASQGPQPKSLQQIITNLGLTTNLKLLLEAGNSASYSAGGVKWLDESGGGYDFYLGNDGTTSPTSTTDPSFVGTPGSLLFQSNYWALDGGDWFTYDSANEVWMQNLHKDGTKHSVAALVYLPDVTSSQTIIGDMGTLGSGDTGWKLRVTTGTPSIAVSNNGVTVLLVNGPAITANAWHLVTLSIDETAGTGVMGVDGTFTTFVSTYVSPATTPSTFLMQIAAAGYVGSPPNPNPLPLLAGSRMSLIAVWEGIALTQAQLTSLSNAILHNDDLVWGPWTPYSTTDVTARALAFGVRLNGSPDGSVSPAISKLGVTIDMPDRHLGFSFDDGHGHGSGTSPGGFTIYFTPPFRVLKSIALANYKLDASNGEWYQILSYDAYHVTIIFTQGGAAIDKTFSLHAYGYGEVIS